MHNLNISYYGGKSVIVPLPLNVFKKMLEDSFKAAYTPNPQQVKDFFEYSCMVAANSQSEQDWYNKVVEKALNWLG